VHHGPIFDTDTADPVVKRVSSYTSVTVATAAAMSEVKGIEPTGLSRLAESLRPEALDALVADAADSIEADLQVTFPVDRCKAILYGDGRVVAVLRQNLDN